MTDRPANRKERRAAGDQTFDEAAFLRCADKFISLANRENKAVKATDLHLAFLFAAARYNAHVGKTVLAVDQHEDFVASMTKTYQEMLRQHLADDSLDPPKG
ncbi:MAG: DUF3144 domain-containing protein [Rhodobiaceae bacterium]|nr:DUF3144 domain-containing protein [Rhodobiaceae bacterium]